jgi:hypothetical protein
MCSMYRNLVAALSFAVSMAGCSTPPGPIATSAKRGCEEAVAQAAATGKSDARLYAVSSLRYQIQDLKGYMVKDGYRGVTVQSQRVDCRPYPLTSALTNCVATARLCSH